jgi:hypothetical protein
VRRWYLSVPFSGAVKGAALNRFVANANVDGARRIRSMVRFDATRLRRCLWRSVSW